MGCVIINVTNVLDVEKCDNTFVIFPGNIFYILMAFSNSQIFKFSN